jgi:hypothetical protein
MGKNAGLVVKPREIASALGGSTTILNAERQLAAASPV